MRKNKKIITFLITASIIASFPAVSASADDIDVNSDYENIETAQEDIVLTSQTDTKLFSEPVKAIYTEYIFGNTLEDDISVNNVAFYSKAVLEECEPTEETHNLSYMCLNDTGDFATMRTEQGGSPCIMTTKFCRPLRTDSPVTTGNICFDAGPSFTVNDNNITFEVEFFDNTSDAFSFLYVSGLDSGTFKTISIPTGNTNTWQTFKLNVDNAYFNRSNPTGLVDGKCDFRVESRGRNLYVRRVAAYTCSKDNFDAINSDIQSLTLPVDTEEELSEGFELPVSGALGTEITWTSDSPYITINGGIADVSLAPTTQNVTLTARAVLNGNYLEKSFTVKVAAEPYKTHALTIGKESWSSDGGKRRVSVPITEADKASGDCMLLLVASDKNSGKIEKIVTDSHALGAQASFTLSAETDFSENLKYDYYVLNLSGSSLRNAPPAPPVLKTMTSNRKLYVQWKKTADDFDSISEYAVLIDGKEVGRVSEVSEITGEINSYIIKNARENTEYNVSVIAYDHEGLTSEAANITATLAKMASINLADPENTSDGLSFIVNDNVDAGDSYTEKTEKDGVVCRKNVNRQAINGKSLTFLYFTADRNIVSSDEKNVTIEITYFDEGMGSILLQYNALGDVIAKQTSAAELTNSKTWKTAVINLTDANFTAPVALTNSDFRITSSSSMDGEICISKVSAIPTAEY